MKKNNYKQQKEWLDKWSKINNEIECIFQPIDKTVDTLEKLAEYVVLEEEKGKWVFFPAYVYCIIGNEVRKGFVFEATYCVCRKPLYTVRYDDNSLDKHTGYLGSSVFLTKEEAEEKLKELQSK